ncbi:MAG: GAF domain-containing protein [Deltaproteobacteria bacterium]|nr:GAF domain-containing protein [Deltaproteobacteria bacterium]
MADQTHTGAIPQELTELRALIARAGELAAKLEVPQEARAGTLEGQVKELEERLVDVESDRRELANQLADCERQISRLMNLYVATYQLHATLDVDEVKASIGEVAVNVLGAERFVLLFWKADGDECEVALAEGIEHDTSGCYNSGVYAGGDAAVDATLADGTMRLGPLDGSTALAAVPLTIQGKTLGALVLLKLFDHRPALGHDDRELLDLLAAHAASALVAAAAYSSTNRKLKSLRSMLELVRR